MLRERRGFGDELVDAVSQQGERGERWNGDHQAGDGGDERLVDAFGELPGAGVALSARDFAKTKHHADDGAEQSEHWREIGQHRQVFDAAEEPRGVLRERLLQGFLDRRPASIQFAQAAMQDVAEKARLFMARLPRLDDAASEHQLPHLFRERLGQHERSPQGKRLLHDQIERGHRKSDQGEHDRDSDRSAREDDFEE